MRPHLTRANKAKLTLQIYCGWLCVLPLYMAISALLKWRARYRIQNMRVIRREYKRVSSQKAPLIVCANHLTLIDSVLMMWAFAGPVTYLSSYRCLPWNLPAVENTKRRLSWMIITYLAKCILVNRMGSASQTKGMLDKAVWLLNKGEVMMLFPEGTRSRSGRVNMQAINYGIGKLLQRIPGCRVLCVYQRGRHQKVSSDFPNRGEVLDITMEMIVPHTRQQGLRGVSDLSLQVAGKLREMEDRHMGNLAQFHRNTA